MIQRCRYCANARMYGDSDFMCEADAPCGNNGCGAIYNESKARCFNKCQHFKLNEIDLLMEKDYNPQEPQKNEYRFPKMQTEDNFEQVKF